MPIIPNNEQFVGISPSHDMTEKGSVLTNSARTIYTYADIKSGLTFEWGDITGTLSNQTDLQNALDAKQETLVSATNIKTINGTSVLGSGDLAVGGGSGFHAQLLPGGSIYGGIHQSNIFTGGSTYNNSTYQNQIHYFPFIPNHTFTSTELRIRCGQAGSGQEARLCIYSHDGLNAPQDLLFESANIDMSTSGIKTVNVTRNWTKGQVYWFGIHMSGTLARIQGSGSNKSDTIMIGMINGGRIKTWTQNQDFANGAPSTANINYFSYYTYSVEIK